jgi:hypothetical protein
MVNGYSFVIHAMTPNLSLVVVISYNLKYIGTDWHSSWSHHTLVRSITTVVIIGLLVSDSDANIECW